jgi:CheY-like chemotaxis protein
MDIRMPIMDGYEATRRIKEMPTGAETVIVALTASAFEENRLEALEQGCDDFVCKLFRECEI